MKKLYEMIEGRRKNLSTAEKTSENIRAISGRLVFEGTGETTVETDQMPFGCIGFLEEPVMTFGSKVVSGTITKITILAKDYKKDTKSMYKSCAFSVTIDGEPSTGETYYKVEIYYTLTGRSYVNYETGGETF